MNIDHENGYAKQSVSAAVIPKGASGEWDDYFIYGVAAIEISGVVHTFYSGTRNVGANPRLEGSIGYATSSDGLAPVKQGKIIDKTDVPDLGLSPFSIIDIGGVFHLFCAIFNNTGTTYNCCVLTAPSITGPWTYEGKLTGLDVSAHSPCVIEDPADSTKLIMFYTSMLATPGPRIKRASALKTDPTDWTGNVAVTDYPSIYPAARWEGDRFRIFFSMPATHGYRLYASASLDGLSFPDTNLVAIQPGVSGAWDESYITTPNICGNLLYYSARKMNGLGYEGIGVAKLDAIGGTIGWDWVEGGVGPCDVAHSGNFGMRLVAGSKGRPAAFAHGRGRDKSYEVWIYDDLTTNGNFQNTFRLLNAAMSGPVLGIWCGASTSKYIYRANGSGWLNTGISRVVGWHKLTFEVGDGVVIKLDDVTIATDTVLDTDADFTAGVLGYDYGIGYADDFSITDL